MILGVWFILRIVKNSHPTDRRGGFIQRVEGSLHPLLDRPYFFKWLTCGQPQSGCYLMLSLCRTNVHQKPIGFPPLNEFIVHDKLDSRCCIACTELPAF